MQSFALLAAFWVAVLHYRGEHPVRFVAALVAAAVFAHAGWGLLHWPALRAAPGVWLDPSMGYCVLFAPLGFALLIPEAAAFRALPLALAAARSGCLAAGCCHGPNGEPTPLFEIAAWLGLHTLLLGAARAWVAPLFCTSFGAVRIALAPWRADPPLGEPWLDARWLAAAWVGIGVAFALSAAARRRQDS